MNNLEKLAEALKDNPELEEKIAAEAERIAEAREASGPKDAFAKAVSAVLKIELAGDELNEVFPQSVEMSPEKMEQVSSGGIGGFMTSLKPGWNIIQCRYIGSHDFVWKGEWTKPKREGLFLFKNKILRCSRCGKIQMGENIQCS